MSSDDESPLLNPPVTSYRLRLGNLLQKKWPRSIAILVAGGLLGGPIGICIASAAHIGLVATIATDIGGVLLGTEGVRRLVRRYDQRSNVVSITGRPGKEFKSRFRGAVQQYNDIEALQVLIDGSVKDPWFSGAYRKLLEEYYQHEHDPYDTILAVASDTIDHTIELLLHIFPTRNREHLLTLHTCSETIVMMSLYHDVYEVCKRRTYKENRLFQRNATFYPIEHPCTVPMSNNPMQQLPGAKTASKKLALLMEVHEILSNRAVYNTGADEYLVQWIDVLVESDIEYPFAECIFIQSLLPDNLHGQEAYVMSTITAAMNYVTACSGTII